MSEALCMPIKKLLMHWHHSSTSQVMGTRRKWRRPVSLKVPPTHRPTGRTTGQPGQWCVW